MNRSLLTPLLVLLLSAFAAAQQPPAPKLEAVVDRSALAAGGEARVAVVMEVPAGYHAQSNKPLDPLLIPHTVSLDPSPGITAAEPIYPAGHVKNYGAVGDMSVYDGRVVTVIPIKVATDAAAGPRELSIKVRYQICDDTGTCLRPQTKTIKLATEVVSAGSPVESRNGEVFQAAAAGTSTAPSTNPVPTRAVPPPAVPALATPDVVSILGYDISLSSVWVALPLGLIAGILFNIMPCVLPVLPLKAMGFYEASQHNRARTIAFGLWFSLGVILVFVGLALFVILSKSILGTQFQWGQWFAVGWVVWTMGIVLVLLGLGMLGAFALQLPNVFYALEFRHDTYTGNLKWGMLTALLSTPCTAPMFGALIVWAVGQNLWIATATMLSVGVGMALPYLILSAFPEMARGFPRTGPASELVKQSMAFPLFATAAWLVGPRIVEDPRQYWLVVAVVGWGAMFVLIRGAQILKTSRSLLVLTAITTIVLAGTVTLALAMNGVLEQKEPGAPTGDIWTKYDDATFAAARKSGNPVLVKFTAAWCLNCQYVERTVFKDPAALEALRQANVTLIKVDLTRDDAPGWTLLNELGQTGIPLTAIYMPGHDKPALIPSIYTTSTLLAQLPQR